jgi:hypothetical protein
MNVLCRKIHELEENVLDFPSKDDDIKLHIGLPDECLKHCEFILPQKFQCMSCNWIEIFNKNNSKKYSY